MPRRKKERSYSLIITTEFENYELGSDLLGDLDVISEVETEKCKRILKETGYTALRENLEETINGWKKIQIHIAVTGESGTGKSSFINSIRGLKADDPGAAEVGTVQTTLIPKAYDHPDNPNLRLWDLPGVGTPDYPQDTYLQKIDLSRFDFFLLLWFSRLSMTDVWLAKKILKLKPDLNLFLVGTMIDFNIQRARLKLLTARDLQDLHALPQKLKDDARRCLLEHRIYNANIYLVNNYDTAAFDFGTMFSKLIQEVSSLKMEAMIMSISAVTNEVVQKKLAILKSRINLVSQTAAAMAVTNNYPAEIKVLLEECRFYRTQLGVSLDSLEIIANRLEVEVEELLAKLSMQSYVYVESKDRFAMYYSGFEKIEPRIWHSLPLFGIMLKVKAHQKQCACLLKEFLDMCAKETHDLQMHMIIALEGS